MADVAARLGISKMSVSRALREDGRAVSPALRAAILRTAREMGYVIDLTARTFTSKRSGFIAAVIPSLNNSNFAETARGLSAAIEEAGLQLLLGHSNYDVSNEERLVRGLLARRPEGLVLTGGRHTREARQLLMTAGIPTVETWDLPAKPIDHVVGFSNAGAAAAMVEHLHARGYRRIAFIGGTTNRDPRGADRRRGYVEAIRRLGLPGPMVLSFGRPPISMAQGAEAVARLVAQWPQVEAVLCVSDLSAFGALAECQRRGWAVPERIAIAGFGDFEVGRHSHPRITTVAIDCEAIGRLAGEVLLRAIGRRETGEPVQRERIVVPCRVMPRDSS